MTKIGEIRRVTEKLGLLVRDPSRGLPEEVFLFVSEVTPLVNVDLLIKDERGRTLMTWRNDTFDKAGWHIPGGIIRFKESIGARIRVVARQELGADVDYNPVPAAISEVIHPTRKTRGHFISLLYRCSLITPLDERLRYKSGKRRPGVWKWHDRYPRNTIAVHKMYRFFL